MQLTNGSRLGAYEIIGAIGAGGMGEVYKARDTRLGRIVAIKVLPPSADGSRHQRFQREARAVASLNHPHICALYDVGEFPDVDGETRTPYLVIEYIEGETLAQRLKRSGLSFHQAVRYGTEIADALDAAHQRGVLHRDLKPSNVMLTDTGAKLVDFGLAKYFRDQHACETADQTAPDPDARTDEKSLTAEGVLVGTLEYMSPEQIEGHEADARSDVFALGICLYEMATRHRPFEGPTKAAVIAAILERDPPPVSTYQRGSPSAFDWLVRACLEKSPAQRIQAAHDVALELRRIAEVDLPAAHPKSWKWIGVLIGSIGAVIAAAALTRTIVKPHEPLRSPMRRFSIALRPNAPIDHEDFEHLAISPDGRTIVYSGGTTKTQLFRYSLDTQELAAIPETSGARGPFFSPDGNWIGFYTSAGELKKLSVSGGAPMTLATHHDLRGAAWGPDNTIVFAELRAPLQSISADGGATTSIGSADPQRYLRWPSFLPDGEHLLYTIADLSGNYDNANLGVMSLKTGQARVILQGATYGHYVATGHIVYYHGGALLAVPFNLGTLTVTGPPTPIAYDVAVHESIGLAEFVTSADGAVYYVPRATLAPRQLVSVDRSGDDSILSAVTRVYDEPRVSPDGRRLIVTVGAGREKDVWMLDLVADSWHRVTNGGWNVSPVWSPDGTQLVFSSNSGRGFNLFLSPADGSAPPKQISRRASWPFATSWSSDGRMLAVIEQYRSRRSDVFVFPVGGGEPQPLLTEQADEMNAVFSPDEHWLAYQSNESGRFEVYVRAYPAPATAWQISSGGGIMPRWSRDGHEIFYRSSNALMSVSVEERTTLKLSKPVALFRGDFEAAYDVFPDGRHFVMLRSEGSDAAANTITAVLNFADAQSQLRASR